MIVILELVILELVISWVVTGMSNLLQGANETHVMLTPGACGSERPHNSLCHHNRRNRKNYKTRK